MKNAKLILFTFLVLIIATSSHTFAQTSSSDLQELVGLWKLDLTPEKSDDSNFAMMEITSIDTKSVKGTFYREGVSIEEGRVNTQRGIIYVALVSRDGTGQYNSSFYYQDGKLYGSTHAIKRDFLAVWIATKDSN